MLALSLISFLGACLVLPAVRAAVPDIGKGAFNPRDYTKKVATCKAVNRAEGKEVDIQLHYVDVNPEAKQTLLLVHGWPSLWSSWKYQIQEFQDDYRLIIPDLRGFGSSTHPGDVKSSGTMFDLVGDLLCILKDAKVAQTVCVGYVLLRSMSVACSIQTRLLQSRSHDWGCQICFEAGRSRPDVFNAIIGLTIPYLPSAGHYMPIKALIQQLPRLSYTVFFDEKIADAVAELSKDVQRTLRATLRTVDSPPPDAFLTQTDSFLGGWKDVQEIPPIPFFTQEEEDYWVEQYDIQKFNYTLYFYTSENRKASYDFVSKQGNYTLLQPVLNILPESDPVADWVLASKLLRSADYLPYLTSEVMPGAHWHHLEHPAHANQLMRKWLDKLAAASASAVFTTAPTSSPVSSSVAATAATSATHATTDEHNRDEL
ncbi:hypothetical protein EWM64_g7177 [Hericium alpestre]|uniref:AB hydrolase-1 domain-containing protein n=1 Tax=Hericium alpestre TaxID=135208 RepID=A0A4Y9ZPK8_9AGAM|nr:hypothetical protein EWM64_g7177 [Hericium alpestre]